MYIIVDYVVLDVSQHDRIPGAVKSVLDKHKKIDVLVNNAGVLGGMNLQRREAGREERRTQGEVTLIYCNRGQMEQLSDGHKD